MNGSDDREEVVLSSFECGKVRIPSETDNNPISNDLRNKCARCDSEMHKNGGNKGYVELRGGLALVNICPACIDELIDWIQCPREESAPPGSFNFERTPDPTLDSRCMVCCDDIDTSYFEIGNGKPIYFHEKCNQGIVDGLNKYYEYTDELIGGFLEDF
jgi:hypothetical protein